MDDMRFDYLIRSLLLLAHAAGCWRGFARSRCRDCLPVTSLRKVRRRAGITGRRGLPPRATAMSTSRASARRSALRRGRRGNAGGAAARDWSTMGRDAAARLTPCLLHPATQVGVPVSPVAERPRSVRAGRVFPARPMRSAWRPDQAPGVAMGGVKRVVRRPIVRRRSARAARTAPVWRRTRGRFAGRQRRVAVLSVVVTAPAPILSAFRWARAVRPARQGIAAAG